MSVGAKILVQWLRGAYVPGNGTDEMRGQDDMHIDLKIDNGELDSSIEFPKAASITLSVWRNMENGGRQRLSLITAALDSEEVELVIAGLQTFLAQTRKYDE